MDLSSYKQKFVLNKGGRTKEQELAAEIFKKFERKIKFSAIMSIIKSYGFLWTLRCFEEVKKANADNPLAFFLWKIKQVKIIYDK